MRITRHQMFMEIAHTVAKRSTCFRESVGAVIVKDKRVISIGYNGAPLGQPHCKSHPDGKCSNAVHAESNAIIYALPLLDMSDKCDLYVTHLPCPNCTELIMRSSIIKRVFFSTLYGDADFCHDKLKSESIELYRVLPSGTITKHDRSEMICLD